MQSCCTTRHASFTLFTQLPTELRLKIYGYCLSSSPRIVPLLYLGATTGSAGYTTPHHGCTSPAVIPSLLHTSQECRALAQEYYQLSFNLDGPPHMFPPKIWFSNGRGVDDVLYFPSQVGYLASFKRFVLTMTVLDPAEALKVRRLAVHEDLFLQARREKGPFDWNPNASRSKDALIDRCVRDFWDLVKSKFRSVEEITIVGMGMEQRILDSNSELEMVCEDEGSDFTTMVRGMTPRRKFATAYHESLYFKITRAVAQLQEMDGLWMAPKWRVLSQSDHTVTTMVKSTAGNESIMYSDEEEGEEEEEILVQKLQCFRCDEKSSFEGKAGMGFAC